MGGVIATADEVLDFWFPAGLDRDEPTHRAQIMRWFRGGTTSDIVARFVPTLEAAAAGALDRWAAAPRGRLALIVVLDQFSRGAWEGARMYACDPRAQQLAVEGLDRREEHVLPVWERMFFALPLGHSEDAALQERSVEMAESLVAWAPPELRPLYEMAAAQARAHRDVIARFGRHPHRNAALGRPSTPDELAYLAQGDFPHTRHV